jgi:hypothetical protein
VECGETRRTEKTHLGPKLVRERRITPGASILPSTLCLPVELAGWALDAAKPQTKAPGWPRHSSNSLGAPDASSREANIEFYRTRAAYFGGALFVVLGSFLALLIWILHVWYPQALNVSATIDLYVGFGTALLAIAAIVELYFRTYNRILDLAPNLGLSISSGKDDRVVSFAPGIPFHSLAQSPFLGVTNVGPGIAKDLWTASIVDFKPKAAKEKGDGLADIGPRTVQRFVRVDGRLKVPLSELVYFWGDEPGGGSTRASILVGCHDLEGRLGDVQVLSLRKIDSENNWVVLDADQSERMLWELTKGRSRLWWRRMGFTFGRRSIGSGYYPFH